jgi:hypothetical protein
MALTNRDAALVLGMVARGDKKHDIAAYFGEPQACLKDVQDGKYRAVAAVKEDLPPRGPPGVKGRRTRYTVEKVKKLLEEKAENGITEAIALLAEAMDKYDRPEA